VQHFAGRAGMPRRYIDYPDGLAFWNEISSIGTYITAGSLVIFFVGVIHAFVRKQTVSENPWGEGANTLEWTLPSPPPYHQFEQLPDYRAHEKAHGLDH